MSAARSLKLQVVLAAVDKITRPIKDATASSTGLARSLKETRAKIKDIQNVQLKADGFARLKQAQQETAAAMAAAQRETKGFAAQLKAAQQAAQPAVAAFEGARARTDQLRSSQKALTTQIRSQDAELKQANATWEKNRQKIVAMQAAMAKSPTTAMRAEYQQLTAAQAEQLKKVRALEGGLKTLRGEKRDGARELNKYRGEIQALHGRMKEATGSVGELERQFNQAKATSKQLKDSYDRQGQSLERERRGLAAAGIGSRNLASHQQNLKQQLSAATASLGQQEVRLARVNAQQKRMNAAHASYGKMTAVRDKVAGNSAGAVAAGTATGAALSVPISEYAKAEDSAMQLRVAMMNAGGQVQKEFGAVNALAVKLGNQLPGTTSDFQDMMRVLIQKGMSAKVVLGGAGEATAKLAVLTNVGFSESATAISVLQDSMGVLDKDMVAAADQMQRLYNVGMNVGDIQQGFKAMGPALAYVRKGGIDAVKALSPLLAITDAAGMDASSAGNAYNKIIRGSVDKNKVDKSNKALKGTGVKLNFVDAKGNFAGVDNMVGQIMKLNTLSDQKRKTVVETIFGSDKEVAEVLNALGKAGNAGIEAMRQKLANQASLQERVNAQLGTLKNLADAAGGAFTGAMVNFGEAIAPELKAVTEWIGELSERVAGWVKDNPVLANTLMKVAAVTAGLLVALGSLGLAFAAVIGPMALTKLSLSVLGIKGGGFLGVLWNLAKGALPAIGKALLLVGRLAMANPILLVISLLAAAAVYLWQNWDRIGPRLAAVWNGIKAVVMAACQGIVDFLMNWTIVGFIVDHWEDLKAISLAIWALIKNGIAAIAQGIADFFMNWTLLGVIVRHWDGITASASTAWQWVKDKAVAAGRGIADFFMNWTLLGVVVRHWDGITSYIGGLVGRFATLGGQLMDGLINGFIGGMTALKNTMNNVGESAISWFKEKLGIHSPSRVFATLGGWTMAGLAQGLTAGQAGPLKAVTAVAEGLTRAGTGIALPSPQFTPPAAVASRGPLDVVLDVARGVAAAVAGVSLSAGATAAPVAVDARPPLKASAPAPSAAGGNQYIFQITAAPGMSEERLAKLVAAEVEKLERRRQVRARSRLSDNE